MFHERKVTISTLAVSILLAITVTAIAAAIITFCALRPRLAERRWECTRDNYNAQHDEKQASIFPRQPESVYSMDLEKGYAGLPTPLQITTPSSAFFMPSSHPTFLPQSPRSFRSASRLGYHPLTPRDTFPSSPKDFAEPVRPLTSAWTASTISIASMPHREAERTSYVEETIPKRFSFSEDRPLTLKEGPSWEAVRLQSHRVSIASDNVKRWSS